MAISWMVIYPFGDLCKLDIAEVVDYKKDNYALASFKEFKEEGEAASYARILSLKSGIPLSKERNSSKYLHILDLDDDQT